MGALGSLHCAGMCGPLVLLLPATGSTRMSYVLGRGIYNLGRIAAYGLLGGLSGSIGGTLAMAGLARWASIGAGVAVLLGLFASSRSTFGSAATTILACLRSRFGSLLRRQTQVGAVFLGALNGFLPCGLVYSACAGAVATGGFVSALEYMLAFAVGTVPMMLGLGLIGKPLHTVVRLRFQKLVPVCVAMLGALLILRGLSLGIPFLSPVVSAHGGSASACH
ncbi:MAG: sulfite exporter TauE/SafE family protein [Limisphaerales bacterium]